MSKNLEGVTIVQQLQLQVFLEYEGKLVALGFIWRSSGKEVNSFQMHI